MGCPSEGLERAASMHIPRSIQARGMRSLTPYKQVGKYMFQKHILLHLGLLFPYLYGQTNTNSAFQLMQKLAENRKTRGKRSSLTLSHHAHVIYEEQKLCETAVTKSMQSFLVGWKLADL